MPKYRKKPIVIDAIKVTRQYLKDKPRSSQFTTKDGKTYTMTFLTDCVLIETLEGTMQAELGDYVITGVMGEKYPCRSDIFESTYEPVEEGEEYICMD
jgi:hypothetical protein